MPDRMSTTGDQTPTAGNTVMSPSSPGPSNNHQELATDEATGLGVEEEDIYQSDEANLEIPVEARRGGDRRLAKVLEHVSGAAEHMTRSESRVVIELLDQVLESRRSGSMLHLVKGLVSKGKKILSKLEKLREIGYDSSEEQTEQRGDGEVEQEVGREEEQEDEQEDEQEEEQETEEESEQEGAGDRQEEEGRDIMD